jgi:hypothetical protein
MRFRKALQVVVIILAVVALALVAIVLRVWWASSTPSRPKSLPVTSTWYPVPPTPLNFSPDGYWLACWVDHTRNVNRCKLTDYKGRNSEFETDYSPLGGSGPVPEDQLRLISGYTTDLFAAAGHDFVPIARLKDGTILVPTHDLAEFRQHPPSVSEP